MAALAGAAAGCLVGSREAAASVEVARVVWPAAGPEAVETAAQTGRAAVDSPNFVRGSSALRIANKNINIEIARRCLWILDSRAQLGE